MNSETSIRTIQQLCDKQGLRLTKTRRQVLELIIAANGPVKAYELLDQLKRHDVSNDRTTAPPTIYRALDFLLQNRFIHKLESINAYVFCAHPEHQHNGQFLICENCDRVIELHGAGLTRDVAALASSKQFQAKRQIVEVYGTCEQCRH